MTERHPIMGGKAYVYRRENSSRWQCAAFVGGKNHRASTKEDSLSRAKDFAEDWYLTLRGKHHSGTLRTEMGFTQAAQRFMHEFEIVNAGERSPRYIKLQNERIKSNLIPYFGEYGVSEITPGKVQDYKIYRNENSRTGKPLARSTIHQEIVALRQILKFAVRHDWLDRLPDLTSPYRTGTKVSHRAWFSRKEYEQLHNATRRRAKAPKKKRYQWHCEQMHDYVLFMANTGLRPDEAARLEHRDIEIIEDYETGERILAIEVRGKRGTGYCKSTTRAVRPYERVVARNKPHQTDLVFPGNHRELFNRILDEEKLKFDREGNRRTAYSLRHTYICLRLEEGADIYQIAKNCRTSVEMIEKYYASHIRDSIRASAVNVMRPRPPRKPSEADSE